jgi:hypothetical protein
VLACPIGTERPASTIGAEASGSDRPRARADRDQVEPPDRAKMLAATAIKQR